jgi:hypothetical protein
MTQAIVPIKQDTALRAVYESTGMLPPAVKIAMATDWATNLMSVVDQRELFQLIQGKKYLQVEAWELIGSFDNCTATTRFEAIEEGGESVGYKGIADLLKDGQRVGGAEASCYLDAAVTRGRDGYGKHRAAQSAAQTWAVSKAFRIKYSFVAVLAGFEPTPAEEMAVEGQARPTPAAGADVPHCPTHPNRAPKEWGGRGDNPPIWKCTAKVGEGYCDWTAPRGQAAPKPAAPTAPPDPQRQTMAEILSIATGPLGWDKTDIRPRLEEAGYYDADGNFDADGALAWVRELAEAITAPEPEPEAEQQEVLL